MKHEFNLLYHKSIKLQGVAIHANMWTYFLWSQASYYSNTGTSVLQYVDIITQLYRNIFK